jgi:NAD(P)-dependent dehydrogenase (short-subunit alcohol dehydrogenase family)
VTAAGIVRDKPFLETAADEARRVLDVNVSSQTDVVKRNTDNTHQKIMGTFLSVQLAAKHMRDQNTGGSIVMIASIAARAAIPSQRLSIYGASKGAVRTLGRQLAVELGPLGIRVNSISPGYIATEMTKGLAITNPELMAVFNSAAPLQRIGDRADLKTAVGYLLSDAAAYTTGSDILVTGGLHAGRI